MEEKKEKKKKKKGAHATNRLTALYVLEIIADAGEKGIVKDSIIEKLEKKYNQPVSERTMVYFLDLLEAEERIIKKKVAVRNVQYTLKESLLNATDLDILEDLITYSKSIDKNYVKELLRKISTLRVGKRKTNREYLAEQLLRTNNVKVFEHIKKIRQAIAEKKQIQIKFKSEKTHIVSPYELIIYNSIYYVVCHYKDRRDEESKEKLETRRIDRIASVEILEEESVDYKDVVSNSATAEFDIAEYISKRIYPMSGDGEGIIMKIHPSAEDTLRENFSDIRILSKSLDSIKVRITTNRKSFIPWYVSYSWVGEVVSPDDLKREIRDYAQEIVKKYENIDL